MSYTLSSTKSIVGENNQVTIYLTTTGLVDGTAVPYAITDAFGGTNFDANDLISGSLTGNFFVLNDSASLTLNIKGDNKTEGFESLKLSLVGPGRTEFITIGIDDTSLTPAQKIFYITADNLVVNEGTVVTFTIRASNVDPFTRIPYQVLGIDGTDLVTDNSVGNIILLPTGIADETSANLQFAIIEDFVSEGLETIFLSITPDFPYVVQVSSTVIIQDSSTDTSPSYSLSVSKNRVIEGESFELSVQGFNVSPGNIVSWKLNPVPGYSITIDDFVGLSNLQGNFPPLNSNLQANVTFVTRDDFIFEQSEYFYFNIPPTSASTPQIELVDSGNTLLDTSNVYVGNVEIMYLDKADLIANIGGLGIGSADWIDSQGKISEDMVLQGRTYYASDADPIFYQPFSYVIRSKRSIEEWRDSVKTLLHPAGLALFSEINNETELEDVIDIGIKVAVSDLNVKIINEVKAFFSITADSTRPQFNTSATIYSDSKISTNITADRTFYIYDTYE